MSIASPISNSLFIADCLSKNSSEIIDTATLDAVRALRPLGFALHWLHVRAKRPIGERWSEAPVASLDRLRETQIRGANLGVRLGEPSLTPGGYLHVLDLDIRIADLADEAWEALRDLFPAVDFDALPMVASGSGGESRHLYFVTDRPFRSKKLATSEGKHRRDKADGTSTWSYDWEIELFGTDKQVAMPPSIHPDTGKPYTWVRAFDVGMLELGLADWPEISGDRLEALAVVEHENYAYESREPLTFKPGQLERTLDDIPDARIDDYHDWIALGQALHHQFGASDEAFELWLKHSARSPKFDRTKRRDLLRKWRGFGRNRRQPVTMATVVGWAQEARIAAYADAFDDLDDSAIEQPAGGLANFDDLLGGGSVSSAPAKSDLDLLGGGIDDEATKSAAEKRDPEWVAKINRRHGVAFTQGKTVIITEGEDGRVDYGSTADLHNFYENDRVPTERGGSRPITRAWMEHKGRRSYPNGIVFAPTGAPPGAFNHWKGFAVEPDARCKCDLFLAHLREVVCSGDDEVAAWVLRWFAHMIQFPGEKPGTALVLRGRKGAGKDTLGEYVGSLFPHHHTKIVNAEHLIGRFNAHQERTLMLHVEEGFWAGDHKAESTLKSLITSEQVQIERKGIDAFQISSVLRVFISSNAEWVVPASFDERRFCVLDVSPHRAGDAGYFAALRQEMDNGGRAGLLHYLKTLNLDGFDVRKPPMTEGLREQKLQSLRNVERWWYEVLLGGELPGVQVSFDDQSAATWEGTVSAPRDLLRRNYSEWLKERRFDGAAVDQREFGKRLRGLCPDVENCRVGPRSARTRVHTFPSLADCRRSFEGVVGLHVDWELSGLD